MNSRITRDRRAFLCGAVALSGVALTSGAWAADSTPRRREVRIGGKRVKTVDVHAHCVVDVTDVVKGTQFEGPLATLIANEGQASMVVKEDRLAIMDKEGIDVQALTINPFWYAAERDLAARLIDEQNRRLAEIPSQFPGRFVVMATAALQYPELAAEQLEYAFKTYGMKGVGIGASVWPMMELSDPKLDPFWSKCQELNAFIFIHPQNSNVVTGINSRVGGNGLLTNVIGNPLETTIGLSHLIFEGTLDKFPNLRLCAAHGGGFLVSYPDRSDHGCLMQPKNCQPAAFLKKKPTDYIRDLYVDSLVFSPEALRHIIANTSVSHVMIGTDCPYPWTSTPVDHVLNTRGLSNADKVAILGGNACRLLDIPVAV
jgi:aminocarboxymuconate-semialdehyde decarboxylase